MNPFFIVETKFTRRPSSEPGSNTNLFLPEMRVFGRMRSIKIDVITLFLLLIAIIENKPAGAYNHLQKTVVWAINELLWKNLTIA